MKKYHALHPIINEEEIILASFWQRALALLIDLTIVVFLMDGITDLLIFVGIDVNNLVINGFTEIELVGHGITAANKDYFKVAFAFIPTIYFALFYYFGKGKTIGKRIVRIRVVSLYHPRISFWHSVERALGYAASTLELGLGFLQIFWNPNRMCLHDRIAETQDC